MKFLSFPDWTVAAVLDSAIAVPKLTINYCHGTAVLAVACKYDNTKGNLKECHPVVYIKTTVDQRSGNWQ